MADFEQTPEQDEPRHGVFASIRQAVATLVALAQTRLELLSTEIEEQAERIVSVLLWGVAAVFVASMAVLLSALALVIVFWDTHRVLVAGGLAVASLLLAAGVIHGFLSRVRARQRIFQATLAELVKDHERLTRE